MLQTILGFYLQSLLFSAIIVVVMSLIWFARRAGKGLDQTVNDRRQFLIDLLMINIMTIPILAFGIVGILIMFRV
ncbi:DUF4059 family protein [Streptococcus gallinaceus]|uniref:DUF4059 family protein n=1 Tax=Streptococcus gallinaceus TaxID=165758 RepID=A0ABV2JL03_9STRE|nr:DUF4059 family protein [Streptococcus gallinaceus]MCP1639814.1 hypothetical protein [Streptococcus gallinaceus]MCP1770596.1 hypothetical protein [Streptococcus gallinaceus]